MTKGNVTSDDLTLSEREIIGIFMSCGIYENVAKDIVKNTPELSGMTERSGEIFKAVLREVFVDY